MCTILKGKIWSFLATLLILWFWAANECFLPFWLVLASLMKFTWNSPFNIFLYSQLNMYQYTYQLIWNHINKHEEIVIIWNYSVMFLPFMMFLSLIMQPKSREGLSSWRSIKLFSNFSAFNPTNFKIFLLRKTLLHLFVKLQNSIMKTFTNIFFSNSVKDTQKFY